MSAAPHIISRQKVTLRCRGGVDAFALRARAQALCSDELPARLNQLFDRFDEPDMVLQLGKISVHVEIDDERLLGESLAKAITEEVELALRKQLAQRVDETLSVEGNLLSALIYFLKRGYLPWWVLEKDTALFRNAAIAFLKAGIPANTQHQVLATLRNEDARTRFFSLIGEEVILNFLVALPVFSEKKWPEVAASFDMLRTAAKSSQHWDNRSWIEAVLASVAFVDKHSLSSFEAFLNQLTRILMHSGIELSELQALNLPSATWCKLINQEQARSGKTIKLSSEVRYDGIFDMSTAIEKTSDSVDLDAPEEDLRIMIQNAGLVILAPFLPRLFSNLGYVAEEKLTDASRAIAIMRYLLAGEQEYLEMDVVLEKILCGLPLSQSLHLDYQPSVFEKEEADALLHSVIEHWSALKSTSSDGLRYNFLLREGRLLFKNNQWDLTVQKETHDILLDYLPWTISMIRLPWMKDILHVKWNT